MKLTTRQGTDYKEERRRDSYQRPEINGMKTERIIKRRNGHQPQNQQNKEQITKRRGNSYQQPKINETKTQNELER